MQITVFGIDQILFREIIDEIVLFNRDLYY